MELQYRHNNGYDSVLLVDDGMVRSDWTVDKSVLREFADCTQDAADWDDRGGDLHPAAEYGDLVAVRQGYTLQAVDDDKWRERVEFLCH